MYQRALDRKEKALGSEHASTLDTIKNLRLLSHSRSEFIKAEELRLQALNRSEEAQKANQYL